MAKGLTKKQEAFAVAFAKSANASEAYRAVYDAKGMGGPSVHVAASRLLNNAKVALRVAALKEPALIKAGLTVERTLLEVSRLAYSDPRKMFRADGTMIPIHELDDDTAATLASIEHDSIKNLDAETEIGRTTKVKVWDKNAALEKAMKHLGLYEVDNQQKSSAIVAINIALVE